METRKVGRRVEFVNRWYSRHNGFTHESTMFIDNHEVASEKVHYVNRTWERYEYQTSMRRCVENYIKREQEWAIQNYKTENDIARLSKQIKEKILADLEKTNIFKLLRKTYQALEESY